MVSIEFWGENYYGHPPLSEDIVSKAEEILKVKLPASYITLLKLQNGGYTKGFQFPIEQGIIDMDEIPLEQLYGIVLDPSIKSSQNILDSNYLIEEWGLPPDQVLISGNGHWWITLDYRSGKDPKVSFLDMDLNVELVLSETFSDFIERLVPDSSFAGQDFT
ncbi:SMI1/KNR4 family protein [Spirosoma endophyticum]|uniref:SMI1 / KNR4 family (SUKH-1) n=1 Tax=Spirosoma endophyticum TaxID=662367 RepID=A0A1I2EC72_9BACT|nr:SMI1/KNR4 family protein [Spirosoma endophyticum]SFE90267.1 SMI1 / KNR4 family (SUKH-1) [Spirosoma endophyticum]